jgi:hypothetical protein
VVGKLIILLITKYFAHGKAATTVAAAATGTQDITEH